MSDEERVMPDIKANHDDESVVQNEQDTPNSDKKQNKLLAMMIMVVVVVVVVAVVFKLSDSSDAKELAENNPAPTSSQSDQEVLNSVLSSLEKSDDTEQLIRAEVSAPPISQASPSDLSTTIESALDEKLAGITEQYANELDSLENALVGIESSQRKIVEVLTTIAMNQRNSAQTQKEIVNAADAITNELGHVRVAVTELGGKVDRENEKFPLLVWGPETYAGEVTVRVSTLNRPKTMHSLKVGDSLDSWVLDEINATEAVFVSKKGDEQRVGL